MSESQVGALVGGIALATASLGTWWVIVAASRGRIRVNGFVGIRTRATLASQSAWQAAHREALPVVRPLTLVSAVVAVLSVAASFWPPWGTRGVLASAGLLVVGVVAGGVRGHHAARSGPHQGGGERGE